MADVDGGMSWTEFGAMVAGLSELSVWQQVAARAPVEVTGAAAQRVIASL